jgi:hypothetical protein
LAKVVKCVFEGAGLELLSVVDDNHRILAVVVVLETRHTDGSLSVFSILPKSIRLGVFLQPQREAKRCPDKGVRWRAARPGTNLSVLFGSICLRTITTLPWSAKVLIAWQIVSYIKPTQALHRPGTHLRNNYRLFFQNSDVVINFTR